MDVGEEVACRSGTAIAAKDVELILLRLAVAIFTLGRRLSREADERRRVM